MGGPITIYYDTQKPTVQSIAGYQSSPQQLGILSIITGLISICSLFIAIKLRHPPSAPTTTDQNETTTRPSTATMSSNVPEQPLSAPVWFSYPKPGAIISFKRHLLKGALNITGNYLTIESETQGQIINRQVSDIRSVKRWAPTMTLYFNDNEKFQLDFTDTKRLRWLLFGPLGGLVTYGKSFDEGLANMKRFEDYFAQQGLLK